MYSYHLHARLVFFFMLALVFRPLQGMLRVLFWLVVARYAHLPSYNDQIIGTIQVYREQCIGVV